MKQEKQFSTNEQKLEKLYEIDLKAKKLEENIRKTDKPIFIELIGTPKSGKTTLKKSLEEIFNKNNINYLSRRETAEYNPIGKMSGDYYRIWMFLEICKNLSEDLSNKDKKVIIYDRGILDILPWAEFALENSVISSNDYEALKKLISADIFKKYSPIEKIFITSPKISIERKGRPGGVVNEESINQYNGILQKNIPNIQKQSSYCNIVKTDEYQGRIKDFITDNVYDIFCGIEKELEKRSNEIIK